MLEIVIVMAIVALLASGAAAWFFGYYRQAETESSAREIVGVLREAQSRSMSGKDAKPWGVYFDSASNKAVLFRDDGAGYAGAAAKEDNYLSPATKINSGSLAGGCNEIIFNNQGAVAQDCTIRIEEATNGNNFKNIIITKLGRIDR